MHPPQGKRKNRKGNEEVGCMKGMIRENLYDTYLSLVDIEARIEA